MKKRILIADDSAELRELYELALEHEGYEVMSVASGEDALAAARDGQFDLVLTDIFMPGMGGLELITRIRSDVVPPVPLVVAISGFPDAKNEALRRGASSFEAKPLGREALVDSVRSALAGQSAPAREGEVERSRATRRAVAEAVLDTTLQRDPDLLSRIQSSTRALSRYFGMTAVVLFLRKSRLVVGASSDTNIYPLESEASDLLSLANDVLDSHARLVLPDVEGQTALRQSSRGVRFFACVPYWVDSIAVGAHCLLDTELHEFSSSDLSILEHVSRLSGISQANPFAPRMMDASGVFARATYYEFLSNSLEWAIERRSAMGTTVVATDELPSNGALENLVLDLPGTRMAIGALDRRRIAMFAASETVAVVHERLAKTRHDLARYVEVRASGELLFSDPVPRLTPNVLVEWADDLLARAPAGAHEVFSMERRVEA